MSKILMIRKLVDANTDDVSLFEVDLDTNAITKKLTLPSDVKGLCIVGTKLYLAVKNEIHVYDNTYSLTNTFDTVSRETVGRMIAYGNTMYCLQRFKNIIRTFDLTTNVWGSSLTLVDINQGLTYAAASALDVQDGAIHVACCKENFNSEIRTYDLNFNLLNTVQNSTHPEDLFHFDNDVWYCDPLQNQICSVSGHQGVVIAGRGHITNGLPLTNGTLVVSANLRNYGNPNITSFNGLVILDNTFQEIKRMPIEGVYISEIIELPTTFGA